MFLFLINSYVDSEYKSISFYCYGLALNAVSGSIQKRI